MAGLWRLEHQFLTAQGPQLPPGLPVVDTDFGPRAQWLRDDYRVPDWTEGSPAHGRIRRLRTPSRLSAPLEIDLWIPKGLRKIDPAPLLWVHDGSGYRDRAHLLRWVAAHPELAPFRIGFVDAPRRMQWYSGSERYLTSTRWAFSAIEREHRTSSIAVMGASLGGLTSMLVGVADPRVGAVFSQSGSFFDPAIDRDDAAFRWFDRIAARVGWMRERPVRDDLHIAMTCGAREGNVGLNAAFADHLVHRGWDVTYAEHPDLHNWTSWRDSLDPLLPNLLRTAWRSVG